MIVFKIANSRVYVLKIALSQIVCTDTELSVDHFSQSIIMLLAVMNFYYITNNLIIILVPKLESSCHSDRPSTCHLSHIEQVETL